jgi:hypothetical protein
VDTLLRAYEQVCSLLEQAADACDADIEARAQNLEEALVGGEKGKAAYRRRLGAQKSVVATFRTGVGQARADLAALTAKRSAMPSPEQCPTWFAELVAALRANEPTEVVSRLVATAPKSIRQQCSGNELTAHAKQMVKARKVLSDDAIKIEELERSRSATVSSIRQSLKGKRKEPRGLGSTPEAWDLEHAEFCGVYTKDQAVERQKYPGGRSFRRTKRYWEHTDEWDGEIPENRPRADKLTGGPHRREDPAPTDRSRTTRDRQSRKFRRAGGPDIP